MRYFVSGILRLLAEAGCRGSSHVAVELSPRAMLSRLHWLQQGDWSYEEPPTHGRNRKQLTWTTTAFSTRLR